MLAIEFMGGWRELGVVEGMGGAFDLDWNFFAHLEIFILALGSVRMEALNLSFVNDWQRVKNELNASRRY
jgi:hypothetical protein